MGEDIRRFHVAHLCACLGCPKRVKKHVKKVKGVNDVQVDSENSIVTVRGYFDAQNVIDRLSDKMHKTATLLEEPKPKPEVDNKKKHYKGESSSSSSHHHHNVEEEDDEGHIQIQESEEEEDYHELNHRRRRHHDHHRHHHIEINSEEEDD